MQSTTAFASSVVMFTFERTSFIATRVELNLMFTNFASALRPFSMYLLLENMSRSSHDEDSHNDGARCGGMRCQLPMRDLGLHQGQGVKGCFTEKVQRRELEG